MELLRYCKSTVSLTARHVDADTTRHATFGVSAKSLALPAAAASADDSERLFATSLTATIREFIFQLWQLIHGKTLKRNHPHHPRP